MLLEIKKVRECREGEYGYFSVRSKHRSYIAISLKKNPTLDVYASTLLHEILHFYTALLLADGFKMTNGKEHKWIEACEKAVVKMMVKHIGRKP